MIGGLWRSLGRRQSPPAPPPHVHGQVVDLAQARIGVALARRARYRYVRPRVEPEGSGWKVISPNCSRSIDPNGGEIDIAWLVPLDEGLWLLYARDHQRQCWRLAASGLPLAAALRALCDDPLHQFWP